ncbi:NAD-dependent epimerase/dehydratase family protein [Pseudomonas chlororaphis]|uniref:NAD-dependent epimerase/dehydratase family protein n=1 Tax=Pseudomonas chlororaphis TaxID=587753 RepID=UPI0018E9D899|nr:NAD-dependent epimerase/dehydratase family protein [Pseudomonas chlororaphis]
MRVLLFGATGMVGQGVLRECLLAPDVQEVLAIGRTPLSRTHEKLRQLQHRDMFDYGQLEAQLQGFDACFFCLGVSAVGMAEAEYSRLTYDLTLDAATILARLNPQMTFVYVSGAGTDSSEQGRVMWARVKGRTENALQRLPFKAVYLFRPAAIQPLHGIRSKTAFYQMFYSVFGPLLSWARRRWPNAVTSTEEVGKAMLTVARHGAPTAIIEGEAINRLASGR